MTTTKFASAFQYFITIAISLPPKTHSKESEKLRTAKNNPLYFLLWEFLFGRIENRQQIHPRSLTLNFE
jgi:hypothetical protein